MDSKAMESGLVRYRRRRGEPSETLALFHSPPDHHHFPATRYQGSKLKLLDWIWANVKGLSFDTALDLFGGTASVGYLFKTRLKRVTVCDYLRSNAVVAKALVENRCTTLTDQEVSQLVERRPGLSYDNFIERTYSGVFFLDEENGWLDVVAQNIDRLGDPYKQAVAFFGLFQACIGKRPYNLFHRANLYMRTSEVERSFGNKATWDRPFEDHFRRAVKEANRAVFDNGRDNVALQAEATSAPLGADLVYIDPPYMNRRGVAVDYLDFYHFLEGLSEYREWPSRVTERYKHKPYVRRASPWYDKALLGRAFDDVFARFHESILVVSYRDNGIPSPEELVGLLKRHKKRVYPAHHAAYKYVLSKVPTKELLLIAE
ncbi:MAG TPA: DNA adenine methylase [Candidatus Eisenbacteria bacterium]|jgi:adenine-specific DNA methylase